MAPTMATFLFGRLIQGFGGGFLLSLSYSMVKIVFDPPLWPRAMGLISGMWGISTLLGTRHWRHFLRIQHLARFILDGWHSGIFVFRRCT
nr:hypothetical protein [Bartonella apihabitans]